MPVLASNGPPAVTDLAQRLVSDLTAGRVARQSINSNRAVAWSWAEGLPMILARQVTSVVTDGLSFNAVRIAPSGTPAGRVAEGAAKPAPATTATTETTSLAKYAGLSTFTTETALNTDSLVPVIASTIARSCLMAYDADCGAALIADNGLTSTGADWPAAINAGIAEVASEGGSPSVLAISAADYGDVVASPGVGYAMNPVDGVPAMYGLRIVITAGLAAGQGFVIDPASVMSVEHQASPMSIIDPYSRADVNEVRCVTEMYAAFVVTSPGGVCEVTKTVAGRTGGGSSSGGSTKGRTRADYGLTA